MKNPLQVLAMLAVLATAGCASVEISGPASMRGLDVQSATTRPERHVVVRNSGFHFIAATFLTGDLRWDDEKQDIKGGSRWFHDCTNHDCYVALQEVARRENCDLCDVIMNENSVINFNMTSYQGVFFAFFGLYEVQVSSVLRQKAVAGEEVTK